MAVEYEYWIETFHGVEWGPVLDQSSRPAYVSRSREAILQQLARMRETEAELDDEAEGVWLRVRPPAKYRVCRRAFEVLED